MAFLSLIIQGPLQRDPNPVMSLIWWTFCTIAVTYTFLPLTQEHLYLILDHLCLPSRPCSVSPPLLHMWSLGAEVIPQSSESKHSPQFGPLDSVCFQSSMYASAAVVTPCTPPLLTAPPVIFHCWPLSSILHGKIPQCWRIEGGPPINNSTSHLSV